MNTKTVGYYNFNQIYHHLCEGVWVEFGGWRIEADRCGGEGGCVDVCRSGAICVCVKIQKFWYESCWFQWHLHQRGIQSDLLAKFWRMEIQVKAITMNIDMREFGQFDSLPNNMRDSVRSQYNWIALIGNANNFYHKIDHITQIQCLIAISCIITAYLRVGGGGIVCGIATQ